jgi:hypothetical protein
MQIRTDTLAVFQAHGTRFVFHYTTAANVLGIVREGALYSRAELERRGINFASDHYFGDDDKQAQLSEYVSVANQPPWGMMKDETERLVILRLDITAAAADGCCYCPGWSPQGRFRAEDIGGWTEPTHVEDLYAGAGSQMVVGAEIFVPIGIPLDQLDALVFFDGESRARSVGALRALVAEVGPRFGKTLDVLVQPERFPPQWRHVGPPWEDA